MTQIDLSQLPSTYYRVSVKALIKDNQDRLLVFQDSAGNWELPGGGLEHGEDIDDCIRRELQEEIQGTVESVGTISFTYTCLNDEGSQKLCLAVPVAIAAGEFKLGNDDIVAAKYATHQEFATLPFQTSEIGIVQHADKIWL